MTQQRFVTINYWTRLQDRFDLFLIALGTNMMRGLSKLLSRLAAVYEGTRFSLLKLVALLFERPLIELRYLCFKLAFSVNQRRILKLGGKQFLHDVPDALIDLARFQSNLSIRLVLIKLLRRTPQAFNSRDHSVECTNHDCASKKENEQ